MGGCCKPAQQACSATNSAVNSAISPPLVLFCPAQPYLSHIIGVGLDSSELGNPPLKFEKVMARVRELGLPVVAHAGEEGPAQYVWDTIKVLKASRVDHGVHSLDDPELMAH
ncbi:adenine deaminase, partial [Haematococcus lacustris]